MVRETWVQSRVESYPRLKKWYLMPPSLTLSIIRYGSRIRWSNPGEGVVPSPTPWCISYRKGAFRSPLTTVANFTTYNSYLLILDADAYIYVYIITMLVVFYFRLISFCYLPDDCCFVTKLHEIQALQSKFQGIKYINLISIYLYIYIYIYISCRHISYIHMSQMLVKTMNISWKVMHIY